MVVVGSKPVFRGKALRRRQLFQDVQKFADREIEIYNRENGLVARGDFFLRKQRFDSDGSGEKRFILFEQILEYGFGPDWSRAIAQREFHNYVSSALRKALLEDDFLRVGQLIASSRKWPKFSPTVLCRAPRRFGKSVAVAMMVAAMAECIARYPMKKRYRISVFSTGGRISEEMAKYVADFLSKRPGISFHKSQKFNVKIELRATNPAIKENPVEIDFYPSNPKFLRGVNSDLLIVDEAAHIDIELWNLSLIHI